MRSTTSPLATCSRSRGTAKAAEDRAAADLLVVAARWADLHPPESIHDAAAFTVPGCEHEEPIAGEGAPLVAEFCLAELGTVLGISTTAAKKLVGHALELRHRLPRLWAQVQAGRVPAWRARAVAEVTIHSTPALTREAAAFVDAQVAAVAGRVGAAQLDRLVAEAIKRFDLADVDPAADPEDGYLHVDPRHVTIHDDDVHFAGTMRIEAELDIADALDLDRALAHGAATQGRLGSTESLGVRRAKALGDLARTQTALDLHARAPPAPGLRRLPAAREVVLHAHFDAIPRRPGHRLRSDRADGGGPAPGAPRPGQGLVRRLPHQGHRQAGHRPQRRPRRRRRTRCPTGSASRSILRDRTCVFPWCTRPARGCDIDHVDRVRPRTPRPKADHSPAPRRPTTSPRCAGSTTASRPTPPGATG